MKIRDNSESGHFRIDTVLIQEGWGSVLGPYGVAAYAVLACSADNETQECWPSYNYIAKMGGMSRAEAYRQIDKLVKLGLIHKRIRYKKGTRYRDSNLYTLLHHSLWQPPRGSLPEEQRSLRERQDSLRESRELSSRTKPKRTNTQPLKEYHWMTEEELERERVDNPYKI